MYLSVCLPPLTCLPVCMFLCLSTSGLHFVLYSCCLPVSIRPCSTIPTSVRSSYVSLFFLMIRKLVPTLLPSICPFFSSVFLQFFLFCLILQSFLSSHHPCFLSPAHPSLGNASFLPVGFHSIHLSIPLLIHPSFIHPSIHPKSIHPFTNHSINQSIYPSIPSSIHPSIN